MTWRIFSFNRGTNEDPPRTRVHEFPNAAELAELQKNVI
jgi:hypothetical protein